MKAKPTAEQRRWMTLGGRAVISAVTAFIRRELKRRELTKEYGFIRGLTLLDFLKTMDERYNKRPGGLGK